MTNINMIITGLTLLCGVLGFALGLSSDKKDDFYNEVLVPKIEKCEQNLPRNQYCHFEAIPNEIIK